MAYLKMEKLYFKDKIAIICGGSKGMGKETSKLIVKMGGSVLIIARDAEVLKTVTEEMNKFPHEHLQTLKRSNYCFHLP